MYIQFVRLKKKWRLKTISCNKHNSKNKFILNRSESVPEEMQDENV